MGGVTTRDVIEELELTWLNNFKLLAESIPANYVEICKEYYPETNIYGFLRDIMLINNFEDLSKKEPLHWALVSDVEEE